MTAFRRFLLVIAWVLVAPAAGATDVVYPPGSRVGLIPPTGMTTSKSFFGYEDPARNAGIILASLPVDAYGELEKTITADALKRQGVILQARESLSLSAGKAFLVVGRQEIEKTRVRKWFLVAGTPTLTALVTVQIPEPAKSVYPDTAIRAALHSLTVRTTVPIEEQLSLLPFKVNDLAGFTIAGIIPGRAVMLSDGSTDPAAPPAPGGRLEPHIFVAVAVGGPAQAGERENFARDAFLTVPNLKERPYHHVGAVADRRPERPPDFRQCEGSGDVHTALGGAVAAVRREGLFAAGGDRAPRRLERRLFTLPHCARRNRAALSIGSRGNDPRSPSAQSPVRPWEDRTTGQVRLTSRFQVASGGSGGVPALSFADACATAGLGPPFATATIAGRRTRSPII